MTKMNQVTIETRDFSSISVDENIIHYIEIVGHDGNKRQYPVSSLRHLIMVGEFWEGRPSPTIKSREEVISEACDILRKNGIYKVDLTIENNNEYDDMMKKVEFQKKVIETLQFTIETICRHFIISAEVEVSEVDRR